MPEKLKYEEVKRIVEEHGYILLQDNYINNRTKLLVGNDFGYKSLTTLDGIRSNKAITWVYKTNPYSIENIQKFLDNKQEGTIILEKQYKHQRQKLKLKCICGNIYYKTWEDLQNEKHTKCNDCIAKERANNRKLKFSNLQQAAEAINLTIIDTQYDSYDAKLLCIDEEGYKGTTTAHMIQAGRKFARFNTKTNGDYYLFNINHRAKLLGQSIKVLSIGERNKWSTPTFYCKCLVCGKEFECPSATFFYGKTSCDDCSNLYSHYSIIIENWLKNHRCIYEREKRFKDCVYKMPLSFDFYLPEINLLIEVDGEGHFYPVHFKGISDEEAIENFNLTKIRDKIKDEYAKDNKISLLRISYKDIKSGKYQSILENFFIQYNQN